MSRRYPAQAVSQLGVALFTAAGAGGHPAAVTVSSLVTSSLMGHDSHGVIRIPEYLGFVADGSLVPDATVEIVQTGATTAVVECNRSFGPVGAEQAVRTGIAIARTGRRLSSRAIAITSGGWGHGSNWRPTKG